MLRIFGIRHVRIHSYLGINGTFPLFFYLVRLKIFFKKREKKLYITFYYY